MTLPSDIATAVKTARRALKLRQMEQNEWQIAPTDSI